VLRYHSLVSLHCVPRRATRTSKPLAYSWSTDLVSFSETVMSPVVLSSIFSAI
jgi:hypothetical protein